MKDLCSSCSHLIAFHFNNDGYTKRNRTIKDRFAYFKGECANKNCDCLGLDMNKHKKVEVA